MESNQHAQIRLQCSFFDARLMIAVMSTGLAVTNSIRRLQIHPMRAAVPVPGMQYIVRQVTATDSKAGPS